MAREDVEFEPEYRDIHNLISKFQAITKLEPILAAAVKAKQFLGSYDTDVEQKEIRLKELDVMISEAQAHIDDIAPVAKEKRKEAEQKLEDDLVTRESNAMGPIGARISMAQNAAKVLEIRL